MKASSIGRPPWGLAVLLTLASLANWASAADVAGRVKMSDFCSPTVSPAVVYLEPEQPAPWEGPADTAEPETVRLSGLQFVPRVQALRLGRSVRFENHDTLPHRIVVLNGEGEQTWTLEPGEVREFKPDRPGVVTLGCGIHLHMRGVLIVSPTPWFQVCSPDGNYRLKDVPAGRYVLVAWHELGESGRQPIVVPASESIEAPRIELSSEMSLGTWVRKEIQTAAPVVAPVRPWSKRLDAISVLLAASRDAIGDASDPRRAQRLLEDAYWGEFEASELESAVRQHLGYERSSALAHKFGDLRRTAQAVAEKRAEKSDLSDHCRSLLLSLGDAVRELQQRGVIDNAGMRPLYGDPRATGSGAGGSASSPVPPALAIQHLKRELHRVQYHADRNIPEEAADSALAVFQSALPPLSQFLDTRDVAFSWWLDREFDRLRGDLATGLKGDALADRLEELTAQIEAELAGLASPPGRFDPRIIGSTLIVTLTELLPAVVVLALLSLLIPNRRGLGPRASRWLTAALLGATAVGIGLGISLEKVPGVQPRVLSDMITGWALVFLAGLLFYSARHLLSMGHSEKADDGREARDGQDHPVRGVAPLICCTILAVVVSTIGASRVLFGMIQTHRGAANDIIAIIAGGLLAVGVATALVRLAARSARLLDARAVTLVAWSLFALSVLLAGSSVFRLQCAGAIPTTNLDWLGRSVPGFPLSLEAFVPQIVLLAAAVWSAIRLRAKRTGESGSTGTTESSFLRPRTAGPVAISRIEHDHPA